MYRENHNARGGRRSLPRAGFSLVELAVVISIIGILAALFLGALSSAQRLTKATATKALIQKLNNAIMSRWDVYRSIRLPISSESRDGLVAAAGNENASRFRQDVARRKMFATRELLRMEMPDRYEDLTFKPVYLVTSAGTAVRPSMWSAYQRRIVETKNKTDLTDSGIKKMSLSDYLTFIAVRYQSAECLYMIMTIGTEDSSTSTEHISGRDVGDVDGDGMFEFIDSWGVPIEFLRWAPGFTSPMQPVYSYPVSTAANSPGSIFHSTQPRDPKNPANIVSHWKVQFENFTNSNATGAAATATKLVVVDHDDPFNPMRVGPKPDAAGKWTRSSRWQPGDPGPEHGFILIPLIYSCGGDMMSGVDHCFSNATESDLEVKQPYTIKQSPTQDDPKSNIKLSDPYNIYANDVYPAVYRGASFGNGYSLDNIHNHDVGTK